VSGLINLFITQSQPSSMLMLWNRPVNFELPINLPTLGG
jgi:hypothetical protein